MLEDRYGLPLSTTSDEAATVYVDAIDGMLAGDGHIEERLDAAIAADPDLALAHVAAARQHQLMGRGREARDAAEHAGTLVDGISKREQQHVEIMRQLIGGQIPSSMELMAEHLSEFPRDAFVLDPACGVFGSIGFSGRIDREPEQLALLDPLATHYGDDWWFLTVHAFALLETGQWQRGRELAERALEIRPDNPHGGHTLAHALYEAGADDEALGFIEEWLPRQDRASLMHCHNYWHYAILLMNAGRHDDARRTYDENLLPETTDSPSINIFTDRASYLWRSELSGEPRDVARWEGLREYYEASFRRPIVFVDAHAALAYAALGDAEAVTAMIDQLQELGEGGRLPAGTTAAELSRGYAAFVDGRWDDVISVLAPLEPEVVRIGGSRAQRDLMTNTLLAAYVNAGRAADAAELLAGVTDRQPSRPVAGL